MIDLLVAAALIAAPLQDAPSAAPAAQEPATESRGVVGFCIRWNRNAERVREAEVVESSGNRALDRRLKAAIPRMDWPYEEGYAGQWVGIYMGVGGAQPPAEATPSCDGLRDRSWPAEGA